MIVSLLHLALRTRPYILVSVLILSRFQKAPRLYCHRGAKRVLRYLKETVEHGMLFRSGDLELMVFVDAYYAADTRDRKSICGFVVKLGDAAVNWGSKKQAPIALSTCEA